MPYLPTRTADDCSPRFIGLDLAKKETQLAALDEIGVQIASRRFETTRANILALSEELCATDTIALEVTTNSTAIARLLQTSPARVIVSNPIKTKIIAEAKIKTDKIDARVLAELARVGYLPEVWLPDPDTEALRHLLTDRRSLVDRRTELKNTTHSVLHRNLIRCPWEDLFGIAGRRWLIEISGDGERALEMNALDRLRIRAMLLELDRLEHSLTDVESVIAAFLLERPVLRAQMDRLVSIPGVSLVVGAGLLAAIGDIRRFKSAKQLASYFGLVPSTYQSGDTKARHGRITKRGRTEARWLAVEAAEHFRKGPGPIRALYTRVNAKRGRNVAVTAVARKLSELVWHLLTKQQDYVYEKPRRTADKRAHYRKLARRRTRRSHASPTVPLPGNTVLYGSGLMGYKIRDKIARLAAQEAEDIYTAIVDQRAALHNSSTPSSRIPLGYDPTRPCVADWNLVLRQFADTLARSIAETGQARPPRRGRPRTTAAD